MALPTRFFLLVVILAVPAAACQPKLVVGTFGCSAPDAGQLMAIALPWSTGFEGGFCDYVRAGGFCFGDPDAKYEIVDAPVHGGGQAAAFSVTSDPSKNGAQARCVLQGLLPTVATYGAWFYLPAPSTNTDNWNLLHFQGGAPGGWHGLWDVSLDTAADGTVFLYVFDDLAGTTRAPAVSRSVPIGAWFHVEFHLARAKDATGEVALYQDGELLLQVTGLVTDDSDAAQWYVGDLTEAETPPDTTLYVDDVTVSASP